MLQDSSPFSEFKETPVQTFQSTPNFFFRHRTFFIRSIIFLALLGIAAGGGYYYAHRPYSEDQILSLIRKNVLPSIVRIDCASSDKGPETRIGTGVYFINQADKKPWVETNAHVVLGGDEKYHGCNVYFPRAADGGFYDSAYVAGTPTLYHNLESAVGGKTVAGLDYALLPLTGPVTDQPGKSYPFPPAQSDVYAALQKVCKTPKDIAIGDKIFIVGYPGTGGDSLTLTNGVVSGFFGDFNEWIKVSASINHGNSGGMAIGTSNGCNYGIPTEATFERGGNLGLVLSSGFIRSFTDGLTNRATYAPPPADATNSNKSLTRSYAFPDFTIKYPDQWDFATSTPDADNGYTVSFVSPLQDALDDFREEMVVIAVPDAPKSSLLSLIEKIKKDIDPTDPYAKTAHYVTLSGTRAYLIINENAELQKFPVPVLLYRIIFWHHGSLYELFSISKQGPDTNAFLKLFGTMADSIEFR